MMIFPIEIAAKSYMPSNMVAGSYIPSNKVMQMWLQKYAIKYGNLH